MGILCDNPEMFSSSYFYRGPERGDDSGSHPAGNDEPAEDIKQVVEGGGDDGGDVAVGGQAHRHHPVECEVQEGGEEEEGEPEELGCRPVEVDHAVDYKPAYQRLEQDVRYLDDHLGVTRCGAGRLAGGGEERTLTDEWGCHHTCPKA